jgi:hypothetical protein
MKNNIILILLISSFILSNCKEKSKDTIVSTEMDINYKNIKGEDLLDTSVNGHFLINDIHVYNVVNGIKKEVDYPNFTYPHNFFIYKNESSNEYLLRVFIETDTTLLQLNQGITDSIICVIDKSNGNEILRKLWYNNVLKWEFGAAPLITIVK